MAKQLTIGLVVPFSTDKVPDEGPMMYPGVTFIPRAVGVRALTPEGYDAAWNGILPAAKATGQGGRRCDHGDRHVAHVLSRLRGAPATARTASPGDRPAGLDHDRGGGRWAAQRRRQAHRGRHGLCRRGQQPAGRFPASAPASRCWRWRASACSASASPARRASRTSSSSAARRSSEAGGADAVLISCGGLLTLGCAEPIEQRHGIPVVTSTQSAFWKAMRLAGDSGHVAGRGRMLAQSQAVPA